MRFLRENKTALLILIIGVTFSAIGVWRGENQTVFRKAIQICLECIGLG